MSPNSGPITVTIREGMVTVAERTYIDARKARLAARKWPQWMTVALRRVEREAVARKNHVALGTGAEGPAALERTE